MKTSKLSLNKQTVFKFKKTNSSAYVNKNTGCPRTSTSTETVSLTNIF